MRRRQLRRLSGESRPGGAQPCSATHARAAARLAERTAGTWAEVAVELGYFDQSHVIRDFTRVVGVTPVAYASAYAQGRAAAGVTTAVIHA